jgi:DNA replication protein DnaC
MSEEPNETPGRVARAPHAPADGREPGSCPLGLCDGRGWINDLDARAARPCGCRAIRVEKSRARRFERALPPKFRNLGWERNPLAEMRDDVRGPLRRYCRDISERLAGGKGVMIFGDTGTGKSSLGYMVAKSALDAGHAVDYSTGPDLIARIIETYEEGSENSTTQLLEHFGTVDLLFLDDLNVARPSEHTQERIYTVINRRYENEKSIVVTADVDSPRELADVLGERTASRLIEMCDGNTYGLHGLDMRIDGSWDDGRPSATGAIAQSR